VEQCTFDLIITDLKQPQSQRLLEQVRSRNPGTRFLILVPPRAQTQHLVYYEQVDIIFQPLSLDETVRKIRYALRQRQLRQAEEDFRRLKQEVMKLFLS
jgi:DNA-binding NtrC family response regulator